MTDKVEAAQAEETVKAELAEQTNAEGPAAEEKSAVNPLVRSVDVTVEAAAVRSGISAELRRIAKKAKMPGFRPGHVPFKMIEAAYLAEASDTVLKKLVDEAAQKALRESNLRIVSPYDVAARPNDTNGNYVFRISFEVFPEFEAKDFSGLELKRYACEITDADVEKTIDIIVRQRVTFKDSEEGRAAAAEDRVTINFSGTMNGEAFEGGSAEGFTFVLAQGRMLPEFETAVTGMKAGEKKEFNLTFPADYGNKDLAGKEAVFSVELVKIELPVYPEVDDAFAGTLGLENVEAFKKEVRNNLEREVRTRIEFKTRSEVFEAAMGAVEFPLPEYLVENAKASIREQFSKKFGADSASKAPLELFAEPARRQTRLGMLLAEIVRQNEITVTDEDVLARAKELSSAYEEPEEVAKWMTQDPQQSAEIRNWVHEHKVCELILGQAKTADATVAFDELMNNEGRI